MKKFFTLVAMFVSIAASAQTESAFLDGPKLLGPDAISKETAVSVNAETVLCQSQNIVMKAAWTDTYATIAMAGESDPSNQVIIDGVVYDMTAGIQGQSNPKPADMVSGGQNSGAVFKFDVSADGILYVFGKLTGNKQYYVWEGDVANAQGLPVAYTLKCFPVKGTEAVSYTLPGDTDGYYVLGSGYDSGTAIADASWCVDVYNGLPTWGADVNCTNTWATTWKEGNALGVIAFPVYKDAETYFVNATGSKITCNGFVFVPGATEIAEISFSKKGTDGINSVQTIESVDAPTYNLGGRAANKGLLIQKGKKFVK